MQTDAKPVSEIDTRQIFHLLPLCHLSLSCVKYIKMSSLPLSCSFLFFCLSFIHNLTFCLFMRRDALLSLQLLLYNFLHHSPCTCTILMLIPILLFSPLCSAVYQTQGQRQRECCLALDETNSIRRSCLSVFVALRYLYHPLMSFYFLSSLFHLFSLTNVLWCRGKRSPL